MSPPVSRLALVTPQYLPHTTEIARAADRLARELARAGVDVVVFAQAGPDDPAEEDIATDGSPCVLRVSSLLEGYALFDLEDRRCPFQLLHAVTVISARYCAGLPSIGQRPLVATVCEADALLDASARRALPGGAWVTAVIDPPQPGALGQALSSAVRQGGTRLTLDLELAEWFEIYARARP